MLRPLTLISKEPRSKLLGIKGDNVAHLSALPMRQAGKVRRYIHLFVALELASDVEKFVPDRVHVARINNKQIYLRRIFTLPPQQAAGYPAKALYESQVRRDMR